MAGLLRRDDEALPVLSILGQPVRPRHLLVIDEGGVSFGLLVTEVHGTEVQAVDDGDIDPRHRGKGGGSTRGVIVGEDGLVLLLDSGRPARGACMLRLVSAAGISLENPAIVVADDSLVVRTWLLRRQLEEHGHVVVEAVDGEDAVRVCRAVPSFPDVVLLDVEMPKMNGHEVLAALRGRPLAR